MVSDRSRPVVRPPSARVERQLLGTVVLTVAMGVVGLALHLGSQWQMQREMVALRAAIGRAPEEFERIVDRYQVVMDRWSVIRGAGQLLLWGGGLGTAASLYLWVRTRRDLARVGVPER